MNAKIKLGKKTYNVTINKQKYRDGNTAIELVDQQDGESFCTLSTNLPDSCFLPDGTFYLKHWSENEGFAEQLLAQKVIELVNEPEQSSGFVSGIKAYKLVEDNA